MKSMFRAVLIATIISTLAYASEWTEEQARVAAFKDTQDKIDFTQYAATDPDHQQNITALKNGQGKAFAEDRFVTMNPVGYMVSHLDKNRLQRDSFFYNKEGQLLEIRLFSSIAYPKAAYTYCYKAYEGDEKQYQPGELRRVSFHPSEKEVFLFTPEGKLLIHDER